MWQTKSAGRPKAQDKNLLPCKTRKSQSQIYHSNVSTESVTSRTQHLDAFTNAKYLYSDYPLLEICMVSRFKRGLSVFYIFAWRRLHTLSLTANLFVSYMEEHLTSGIQHQSIADSPL